MADAQKRKQAPGDDRDKKFGKKAKVRLFSPLSTSLLFIGHVTIPPILKKPFIHQVID